MVQQQGSHFAESQKRSAAVSYRRSRADLRRRITAAKRKYKMQIEQHYKDKNNCSMWQGIRTITNYKQNPCPPPTVQPSLPDQLNTFFSRFDSNSVTMPPPAALTHKQNPSRLLPPEEQHCTSTRLSRPCSKSMAGRQLVQVGSQVMP